MNENPSSPEQAMNNERAAALEAYRLARQKQEEAILKGDLSEAQRWLVTAEEHEKKWGFTRADSESHWPITPPAPESQEKETSHAESGRPSVAAFALQVEQGRVPSSEEIAQLSSAEKKEAIESARIKFRSAMADVDTMRQANLWSTYIGRLESAQAAAEPDSNGEPQQQETPPAEEKPEVSAHDRKLAYLEEKERRSDEAEQEFEKLLDTLPDRDKAYFLTMKTRLGEHPRIELPKVLAETLEIYASDPKSGPSYASRIRRLYDLSQKLHLELLPETAQAYEAFKANEEKRKPAAVPTPAAAPSPADPVPSSSETGPTIAGVTTPGLMEERGKAFANLTQAPTKKEFKKDFNALHSEWKATPEGSAKRDLERQLRTNLSNQEKVRDQHKLWRQTNDDLRGRSLSPEDLSGKQPGPAQVSLKEGEGISPGWTTDRMDAGKRKLRVSRPTETGTEERLVGFEEVANFNPVRPREESQPAVPSEQEAVKTPEPAAPVQENISHVEEQSVSLPEGLEMFRSEAEAFNALLVKLADKPAVIRTLKAKYIELEALCAKVAPEERVDTNKRWATISRMFRRFLTDTNNYLKEERIMKGL